jgi:hypothetical protein
MTKFKKQSLFVAISISLLSTLDAAAVPFFGQRTRGTQPIAQAEGGAVPGLMTGYTMDVQAGLGDFVFLARNFAGANPNTGGRSPPGLIGPAIDPIGIVTPAPAPGSAALLAVGGALLVWRRRASSKLR